MCFKLYADTRPTLTSLGMSVESMLTWCLYYRSFGREQFGLSALGRLWKRKFDSGAVPIHAIAAEWAEEQISQQYTKACPQKRTYNIWSLESKISGFRNRLNCLSIQGVKETYTCCSDEKLSA